jgi:hypothetical protein
LGAGSGSTLGVPPASGAAGALWARAYPNPAFSDLTIRFVLGSAEPVRLRIMDIAGRTVANLTDGSLSAGEHVAHWNRQSADGRPATPGVYFYDLRAGAERLTRRIAVVR